MTNERIVVLDPNGRLISRAKVSIPWALLVARLNRSMRMRQVSFVTVLWMQDGLVVRQMKFTSTPEVR